MAEYPSKLSMSEDVVVEILSRLPPKSLMRFKCVRKSWYDSIKSPSFVAKHLSYAKKEFSCLVFKRTVIKDNTIKDKDEITSILHEDHNDRKETLLSLLTVEGDEEENISCVVEDIPLPYPWSTFALTTPIAGHCDGIVCLTDSFANQQEDIVLCNPALKEFEYLPKGCLFLPPKQREDFDNEDDYADALESSPMCVGFGYDSKAKAYKVVRVVQFSSGYVWTSHPHRAEVFTLGARSWREIKIDTEAHVFSLPDNLFFKGICYWSANLDNKEVLLSFDLSEELFHVIPVPECIQSAEGFLHTLSVWKESIVLVAYSVDDDSKFLEIWVMAESDGSWTKHFTVEPVEFDIPLKFWKSDEILVHTADGCVVSYNLDTQKLKYLPILAPESRTQCVVYVNSIVSVKELMK